MDFEMKLLRHVDSGNCARVKDYLIHAYNKFNPSNYMQHPCIIIISYAVKFMYKHGWKCGVVNCDGGMQFVCVSPDDNYYCSEFEY